MSEAVIQFLGITISALVVVFGWLYNSKKNRKFKRFEYAIEKRLDMLQSIQEVMNDFSDIIHGNSEVEPSEVVGRIKTTREKVLIFASDEEYRLFEDFIDLCNNLNTTEPDQSLKLDQLNLNVLNELPVVIVNNFRQELGLPTRSVVFRDLHDNATPF